MKLGSGLCLLTLCVGLLAGCQETQLPAVEPLTGGSPTLGREALLRYGCVACHAVKGIQNTNATVGPPLAGLRERTYVAGVVNNTPGNLMLWIMHPRQLSPRTAMPELGVSEKDARDIAAFLYQP